MNVTLRPAAQEDLGECARICYAAFQNIATRHSFPPDFPSVEVAEHVLRGMLQHPEFYGVVAEEEGRVIGSNFLDERSPIAGLGPITIDPTTQNSGVGRLLMEHVLERAREAGRPGVRLLQAAYHGRSLSLYAKLGFDVREPLVNLQGPVIRQELPGYRVRAASADDLDACNDLCTRVHGHHRSGEVRDAIRHGTAAVVEYGGRVTGYTTGIGFLGHTVGESNREVQALIGAAPEYFGPGLLLPTRNGELFRWCLENGLQVVQTMTLMSVGLYNEPRGAFLPSILY
ncbi:MAG: GNAT family N-acetyltransferase [Armatimonadota bacterium]